jgi:hypothetical protein
VTGAVGIDERLQRTLPDHYVVERELGRGGMATVFLADDRKHHRHVAVKVLNADYAHSIARSRFVREIEIAAGLSHPGILPLFDSGVSDEIVYYVMPYVEGESLRDLLDREVQLPLETVLRLAREVADALAYAHAHGVVHRDVKPENILLESGHAVVADFGIARAPWAASGEPRTLGGMAVGTPQYMSPEQGAAGTVDHRTDVWALGCVVYEMLAGTPPFTGATPEAVIGRARSEAPPSLEVVRPGAGHAVQVVIEKALAKVPADRWQSAPAFVDALEAASQAPESAEYPPAPRPVPWWRRWPAVAGTAAGVTLLAAAVVAVVTRGPALDDNRIVVFPLQPRGDSTLRDDGKRIGLLLQSALETAEPLKAVDGWFWLTLEQRRDPDLITAGDFKRIARQRHARYALSGSLTRSRDSSRVSVNLLDVKGDSSLPQVTEAGLFDPSFIVDLGLRSAVGVLSHLLAPGQRVDLRALQGRNPAAVVAAVMGDLDYRDAKFAAASAHYQRALALDSQLALAALKGAQAASWTHHVDSGLTLVSLALRHLRGLPPKYRHFALGLQAYLRNDADSAAAALGRAVASDPEWTEAQMALGEVHYHFLIGGWNPDSLAEVRFELARGSDPGFTPALYHLTEIELRRGWTPRADSLYRALRRAGPDSTWLRKATWMVRCVRDGADAVDWTRAAGPPTGTAARDVLTVGHVLAGRQPVCAERAMRAALAGLPRDSVTTRWNALVGLQSLLVAEGRYPEVRRLLVWGVDSVHAAAQSLQIQDAVAGVGTDRDAVKAIALLGPPEVERRRLSPDWLWWLGLWAWHERDAALLGRIVAVVADSLRHGRPNEFDTLIHHALSARLTLLHADTARALALLSELSVRGSMGAIGWEWLAPLAEERLLLARVLLAKGRDAEALAVAGVFDASQPMAYVMYLAASLEIRIRAAERLGRRDIVARDRARLAQLRGLGRE